MCRSSSLVRDLTKILLPSPQLLTKAFGLISLEGSSYPVGRCLLKETINLRKCWEKNHIAMTLNFNLPYCQKTIYSGDTTQSHMGSGYRQIRPFFDKLIRMCICVWLKSYHIGTFKQHGFGYIMSAVRGVGYRKMNLSGKGPRFSHPPR